ncbi:hypothetical protein [Cetobacterium sp.]|uniref:hypothetical protein n=1 Tax=Cetobacterium sp. TaxID=2071632 RepID=UPI003F3789D7
MNKELKKNVKKAYDYYNNELKVGDKVEDRDGFVGIVKTIIPPGEGFVMGEGFVTVFFENLNDSKNYNFKGVSYYYNKGNILCGFDCIKKIDN